MLSAALIAAALLAGMAGSWSPCGLSMIETVHRRGMAIAAFAVGALAGGAVTFGGLALLGETLGAGGGAAGAIAVAALLVAALGDGAGRRIVPQVRRQVPESWRRIMPVPLASALYGVLLGLGFTTFLLTFATWALAAACLAVGTPLTGLLVGIAFGTGRAVPVAALAARADGAALLGERPGLLRGLRRAVAAALLAAAAVLVAAPPAARAASAAPFAGGAADPSASDGRVAYQPLDGPGVLVLRDRVRRDLPGVHPALAGNRLAFHAFGQVVVTDATTLAFDASYPAREADAIAISGSHVAWRAGGRIVATHLDRPYAIPRTVARPRRGETLGRPALAGATLVYDVQSRTGSRIRSRDLETGAGRTLRRARGALLLQPTLADGRLLYVRSTYTRQELVLGNRVIYSTTPTARRDSGHEPGLRDHHQGYPDGDRPRKPARPRAGLTVTLWTTALDGDTAYVTRLRHRRGGRTEARILRIRL